MKDKMEIESSVSSMNNQVHSGLGIMGAFVSSFQSMQLHALQSQLMAPPAPRLPASLRPEPEAFSGQPIVYTNDRMQLEERLQRVQARAVQERLVRRIARQAEAHQLAQAAPVSAPVDLMSRMQF